MNILFIIGNGFDLQLGLPTSYKDFFQYYVQCESSSHEISRLKERIKENPDCWADLEVSLAEFTSEFDSEGQYCLVYDDIQEHLKEYMLAVDRLMLNSFTLAGNSETVRESFLKPEQSFRREVAATLGRYFENISGMININIEILSFNYTHTIEYVLPEMLETGGGYTEIVGRNRSVLPPVVHVHKEVDEEGSVWLGVDNDQQIPNAGFRNSDEVVLRLVKPEILQNSGSNSYSNARNMIGEADVICCFGVSLGKSDLTWVKAIGGRLSNGALLLYYGVDDKPCKTENQEIIKQKQVRRTLMKKFGFEGGKPIESKIFVKFNSDMFVRSRDLSNACHEKNLAIILDYLLNRDAGENSTV